MRDEFEQLKLENQLCFPLYACSKEIVRHYKPHLDKLDLTYTQYLVMMVLWDKKSISFGELGDALFLDSGTLTPVVKKLEDKGYLTRDRSKIDERVLNINITDSGMAIRELAKEIPLKMSCCIDLTVEESMFLHKILHKILDSMA